MKHIEFTGDSLDRLDTILRDSGLISDDPKDHDGTVIGYDGNMISIDEALSLFPEDAV
jgi:hypothetical protein